jgi:hypothetical protein
MIVRFDHGVVVRLPAAKRTMPQAPLLAQLVELR